MLGAPCTKMEPHDRHEWSKNYPDGDSRRVWCAGEGWSEHDIAVWRAGFDEAQRQRNETARPDEPAIINNPDTPLTDFQRRVLSILEGSAEVYKERSVVYKDNFRAVGRVMYALFPGGRPGLQFPEDYDRWHIFELVIVKLTRYANNYDTPHEDSLLDMLPYLGILGSLDEEHRERNPAVSDETPNTQAPISTDIPAPSKGSGFRDPMDGRRFADWYDQAQGSRWDFRQSKVEWLPSSSSEHWPLRVTRPSRMSRTRSALATRCASYTMRWRGRCTPSPSSRTTVPTAGRRFAPASRWSGTTPGSSSGSDMGKAFASIEERRLYIRNHQRVARRRGKASEHTCSCGAPAREWAQLHGKDGSADEHFEAMCHKCHQRYDGRWSPEERERVAASVKANWDAHHTREFSDETRAKMSANHRTRGGRRR